MNSPESIKIQYKTADNLTARISLHENYSVNKQGFVNWLFSLYRIPPNSAILELGCGSGNMWKNKLDLLNNGSRLLLTDISEGMVAAAMKTLGENKNLSFERADIENLPYKSGSFDIVIANMMLYHVPDLDKGLNEVSRVLSDKGSFYCATFGENGIMPHISVLLKEYGAKDGTNKNFTLQNGYDILKKHFTEVKRFDYEDRLEVTDIEDVIYYTSSLESMSSVLEIDRKIIKNVLEKNTVNGILTLPKEYGTFVCKKQTVPSKESKGE